MANPQKDSGFVYLWRSLMDTSFYKNPNTCHLAVHLLLTVAWKDHDTMIGGKKEVLLRGQRVAGRVVLSEETGLSPQEIRTSLKHLADAQFLTIKSTNVCSIITICNFSKYQSEKAQHQPANQPTINQPSTNHQPLQNKDNKGNKEIIIPTDRFKFRTKVPVPDNFHLTEQMKEYANRKGFSKIINLETFTEQFILKNKAKGYQYQDWYAAWQDWLTRAVEQKEKDAPKDKVSSLIQHSGLRPL